MAQGAENKEAWRKLVEDVNAQTTSPDQKAIEILEHLQAYDMYELLCLATYLNALWLGIFPASHEVNIAAREIKKTLIQYHYLGQPWKQTDGVQHKQVLGNESGELSEASTGQHEIPGTTSDEVQGIESGETSEGTSAGNGSESAIPE